MKKILFIFLSVITFVAFSVVGYGQQIEINNNLNNNHDPEVRIGDITRLEGIRNNQLQGIGLVTGLAGTGDSGQSQETVQMKANTLREYGVNVDEQDISSRNTAVVILDATLPPFVNSGDLIDVGVSSYGDASSLQGGTLLQSPLFAADGNVYAVAQGSVSIGGFEISGHQSQMIRQNHPTVGSISNGAIVERGLDMEVSQNQFTFILNEPDFTTASRIVNVINENFAEQNPAGTSGRPDRVNVRVPEGEDVVHLISIISGLRVQPDVPARVIINEREGIITMTHNVRLSTVSVQKGDLTVSISAKMAVEHPPPFTEGETIIIQEEEIVFEQEEEQMQLIDKAGTIEDLIMALNAIGASSKDTISILKGINSAKALHADLVFE